MLPTCHPVLFQRCDFSFLMKNNRYDYMGNDVMHALYANVTLCVGGSKAFAGQYILYCPASRAI